jgi:hypothetical protein
LFPRCAERVERVDDGRTRTGQDPHGAPREAPAEQQLVSDFFEGAIPKVDDCRNGPCYAGSFTGP